MSAYHNWEYIPNDYFSFNKTANNLQIEENIITNSYIPFETICVMLLFILVSKQRTLENKQNASPAITSLVFLILNAISIFTLPLFLIIFCIFGIYRQLIILVLKMKLKSKFGGLLEGADIVWVIEDVSKSVINVLLIVQWEKNYEELHDIIRNKLNRNFFKKPDRFPKLLATYRKAFGYYYLLKNDVLLDDCIAILESISEKEVIEKEELLTILSNISNDPLPKKHTAFWQVLLSRQSVKWSNDTNKNMNTFYPIVFRIHHSLADGASLLQILIGMFRDVSGKVTVEKFNIHKTCFKEKCLCYYYNFIKNLKIYKKNIEIILSAPSKILLQILRAPDKNILHGPSLSGQKLLALKLEDSPRCIEMVKRIKNKVAGVTFSDILLAAISGSFRNFFKTNMRNPPEFITTVIPVYPKISECTQIGKINTSLLDNKFSVAMLNLPFKKNGNSRIIDILEMVKNESRALKDSNYYQINYWLLNTVSTFLPEPFLRPLLKSSQSTLIVSNVPGPPRITMFDGIPLEDVVFWIPHRSLTGVGVSILSYDGRLQIGLNVDKSLINKNIDVQDILDGVYNSLIEIDFETTLIAEDII